MSGPEEWQVVFAHPFATWRTFLHPNQRQIAYHPRYSGPAQVTGGPGTGKTVTVLHRAAYLAERAEPVASALGAARVPFDERNARLALDHSGHLVYLASSSVNLQMAMERAPDVRFLDTREQGAHE